MEKIRMAIIGAGQFGAKHAAYIAAGEVENCELYALCNRTEQKMLDLQERLGRTFQLYTDVDKLLADEKVDAVLIATPHYDHPEIAIKAFQAGKHVLIEKPAGVFTKNVREMNEIAAAHPELSFGIMFNQRTNPVYRKAKDLLETGDVGEIRRTNWIITNWYRPQCYYDAVPWRGTWQGDGGGVLLNQAPHQLDLWQWICGMPNRVMGFAAFGKRRNIQVEDEVTAYVEYPNGATGVFISSVSEVAGTNRFEIIGSKGKLVIEDSELTFFEASDDDEIFSRGNKDIFGSPDITKITIPIELDHQNQHKKITQNFINHILSDEPLIAPGAEGLNSLEISNGVYLSTWKNNAWMSLPIDAEEYLTQLSAQRQI